MAGRNKRQAVAFLRSLERRSVLDPWKGTSSSSGIYVLDGKTPVRANVFELEGFLGKAGDRRVALTTLGDKVEVSTVFLGVDHNFYGEGPPILFETMVFYKLDKPVITKLPWRKEPSVRITGTGLQVRYATWEEAEEGHARVVALVEKNLEHMSTAAAATMDEDAAEEGEDDDDTAALLH